MSRTPSPFPWSVAGWGIAVALVVLIGAIATDRDLIVSFLVAMGSGAVAAWVQWRLLTMDDGSRRRRRHVDPQ